MINRVVLVGRLTRDPELKPNNSGTSVCSFTVAVDNRTKDANGNKTTSFIPCIAFQQSADNMIKFVKKGSLVGVEGRLNQRSFVRQDGTKGQAFEILCDSVQFLEPKGSTNTEVNTNEVVDAPVDESKNLESLDMPDDDLPF